MTITAQRLQPANIAPVPTETPWTLEQLGRPALSFAVYGVPGPQGSKKTVGTFKKGHKREGQAILAESSKKVTPWRNEVAKIGRLAVGRLPGWEPLTGPLVLDMIFTLAPPQRYTKDDPRRVHGMPTVYPDVSKLLRSTEDALTKIAWADDAQIVGYRRDQKVYVGSGDPDALRAPGAVIRVWQVAP